MAKNNAKEKTLLRKKRFISLHFDFNLFKRELYIISNFLNSKLNSTIIIRLKNKTVKDENGFSNFNCLFCLLFK
jgi:hypothetical protein